MPINRLSLISDFVASLTYESLPADVVSRIKFSFLDTLGCGLHGSLTPWGKIVGDYSARSTGTCALWGRRDTADAANAALANATMVHSFELDDLHLGSRSHPGGITIPVALALASEEGRVPGKDLIASIAAGYELTIRVGMAQGVSSFDRGWHPTGTAGCFGATATACRVLGLSSQATQHSLGIGGTMPCGLMAAQYGAMVKRLFAGHAAFVGLMAARLGQQGFTGIADIFDAEFGGYLKAVSDDIDLAQLSDGLGSTYQTLDLGYKFYSCVGASHTSVDATRRLLEEHNFSSSQVRSIRVITSEYQRTHAGWPYEPSTVMAAQMSIQYCVAAMLLFRKVFVDQFTKDLIADPRILDIAKKVSVESDPKQSALDRSAVVEITLNDGRRVSAKGDYPRGHPKNPASWPDVVEKFLGLASKVLPEKTCNKLISAVEVLEESDDVSDISSLLLLQNNLDNKRRGPAA